MASMALLVLPALAPEVAREYGIDASLIGYFITLVCVGQLVTLTYFSNVTRRYGGCRINQAGHGCVALGMALTLLPAPLFIGIGAIVVGCGYGMIGPSFSHLLMRFAPPERRNFIFSLQQTGVPIGGIAAALIAPAIALGYGWRWGVAQRCAGRLHGGDDAARPRALGRRPRPICPPAGTAPAAQRHDGLAPQTAAARGARRRCVLLGAILRRRLYGGGVRQSVRNVAMTHNMLNSIGFFQAVNE